MTERRAGPTDRQRAILRHALGLDEQGRGRAYRNHFVTGPGSKDWDDCCTLTESGLMQKGRGGELTGGDPVFYVTGEGSNVARRPPNEAP
jgi:hypothetical protein